MVHGLPRYLYDQGMFTLEVAAKGQKTASFIVPPGSKTYLVHCDVPPPHGKRDESPVEGWWRGRRFAEHPRD